MSMQPYMMLIGTIAVPVTPDKITTKYKGQNKTVELIDGNVINKLNPPGLTTYSFKLLLPKQTNLPFANRIKDLNGNEFEHMPQDYYLKYFYDIFKNNKVVLFTVWRTDLGGKYDIGLNDGVDASGNGIVTCKSVTIESYSIEESAENGMDIELDLELQEYVGYGTQTFKYTENTKTGTIAAAVEKARDGSKEIPDTYTVKKGDCLINICKKELGDANKWRDIAKLNNMSNPDLIYPGQVIKLK